MTPSLALRPAVRYRIAAIPLSLACDTGAPAPARGAQLLAAIRPSVLRPLTAERAAAYVTILAQILALRRSGALAPTLDDLRHQLSDEVEDDDAFLRDLLQLEEWGCLTRELEPRSIRGYRDARRERFRHRLTDDTVALLEWLESRTARRASPLRVDAEDRLFDVLDRARELAGLMDTEADGVDVRRVRHLVRSIDAELDAITRELVGLHAEMHRFVARTFEPSALVRVVAGLEAYVAGPLGTVGERRAEIRDVVARLAVPEVQARLARTAVAPSSLLFAGHDSASSTTRWSEFFDDRGTLDDHCAKIEAATHDVIAKLRDRMSALERHGDRVHERACAIRTLASIDEAAAGTLALWGMGVPTWAPGDGAQLVPPLPRRKTRVRTEEPRALTTKQASREVVREPRQARTKRIADWLREAGLTHGRAQLSTAHHDALRTADAPTAWMVVARTRHLRRGAGLSELGVRIEPARGVVTVGNESVGLASPDCIVSVIERETESTP